MLCAGLSAVSVKLLAPSSKSLWLPLWNSSFSTWPHLKPPPTKTLSSLSNRNPKDLSSSKSSFASDNLMDSGNTTLKRNSLTGTNFPRACECLEGRIHTWFFLLHQTHGPEYNFYWCWLGWWVMSMAMTQTSISCTEEAWIRQPP